MKFHSNDNYYSYFSCFRLPTFRSAFLFSCLFFVSNNALAQKSSGVLGQPDDVASSYVGSVANVDDDVTQNAYAVESEIRFLIRPRREAKISANMAGKISRVHFNVGQRFRRGQTLVSLHCAELDARSEAQKARVRQAKLTHDADLQMLEGDAVSKFTAKQSKADLDEQSALLKEQEVGRSHCKVLAPFNGGVVSVEVNTHEAISAAEPLMTIIDDSGLVMSLNVPSSYVKRVKPKDEFTVVVDETAKVYKAKIVGVSPMIDPVSKTIELRATLVEGLDELTAGMSGRANLDFTR